MTTLLTRLFVGDYKNTKNPRVRRSYGTMAGTVGIIVNILLASGKLLAGILSASVSITADGMNNFADALTSVISLVSFRMGAKSPDRGHPFGHARVEYAASMIISVSVILVAVQLFIASVKKIITPEPLRFSPLIAGILIASVIVKLWLGFFNRKLSKKISSTVLKATAADSFSDAAATLAVLVSVIISYKTRFNTDGIMGIIVSVIILIAGIRILIESKNHIISAPADPATVEAICGIAKRYPEIIDIHDLIVHNYGAGNIIASMHAEVDGKQDFFYIHDVIDHLERSIFSELSVKTTIHMDPVETDDGRLMKLREDITLAVRSVSEDFSAHDIRVVRGKTYTKLIFDVSVPFEEKRSEEEIKDMISERISQLDVNFFALITIDRE